MPGLFLVSLNTLPSSTLCCIADKRVSLFFVAERYFRAEALHIVHPAVGCPDCGLHPPVGYPDCCRVFPTLSSTIASPPHPFWHISPRETNFHHSCEGHVISYSCFAKFLLKSTTVSSFIKFDSDCPNALPKSRNAWLNGYYLFFIKITRQGNILRKVTGWQWKVEVKVHHYSQIYNQILTELERNWPW